jgi:DNA polymerase-3 subunit alpha
MPDFVHLHNHSDFSLLDGAATVKKLVDKAAALGMNSLALTDHGNMFGVLHFYRTCKAAGIKPIIGSEFYVAPGSRQIKSGSDSSEKYSHLVLLAKNMEGYKNLLTLSSLSYTEGFYYKPRIDHELIERYSEGLVATTACLAGEIPKLLLAGRADEAMERAGWFQEIYGKGNLYLELQDHGIPEQKIVNRGLIDISKKTGIPLTCANDIHYIDREDANAHDILICIDTNKKKNEVKRLKFENDQFYMKSPEQMEELFSEVPEACRNTAAIAEKCNLELADLSPLLPDYSIPQEFSDPSEYLRHLTFQGLKERYSEITAEIETRANKELDIIISMGYTGYFLIVWDFIDFARKKAIPVGPGRGSGAGSIVAYALKITDIDPLRYGLLFERFLNPERVTMPDFDIDFCFERRQEVIDYVTEKYGREKVGQIITFGTLKAKNVIRDVARVLDIPYAEADSIAKLVPGGPKVTIQKALDMEPKLRELYNKGEPYRELIDVSKKLEGLNRHASTHAAGIVIGKKELTEFVPLYRDPKTGSVSTQFSMELLEDCGLVKMDFLGLKTLTLIKNAVDLIRRRGIEIDLDTIPEHDEKTFALLGEGKSKCIFQFESSGMQNILKQAKPGRIEDLIALNALYRPGPMENIPQFIDAKWGRKPISYPHPSLEPILKETYGVIVYQEQVMEIVRKIAGFSLGQADILRRAMGKKKIKVMANMKVDYLKGAEEKGIPKKKAEEIFTLLEPFAGYGFNKSHAAAYSILAYKTAYLKANYPVEFMAANLTNEINDTDKLAEYITECRSMGISVLPPDINVSEKFFNVADGNVVYGLIGIKNVGSGAVEEIVRERTENGPYTSFIDFLERIDLKTINHKVLEALIQSGAFDSIESGRAELCHNLDRFLHFVASKKESLSVGQNLLFEDNEEQIFGQLDLEHVEEWPEMEILRLEKENLGVYFSGHPLDKYREMWEKPSVVDLSAPERCKPEKTYNFLGIVKSIKEIQTKNGKRMAFAQLEDFSGAVEIIFFPDIWEKEHYRVQSDSAVGIRGRVQRSDNETKIIAQEVLPPEEMDLEDHNSEVHLRLAKSFVDEEELFQFRTFLFRHKGSSPVYIHITNSEPENEIVIKASSQIGISAEDAVLKEMLDHPQIEEVWRV